MSDSFYEQKNIKKVISPEKDWLLSTDNLFLGGEDAVCGAGVGLLAGSPPHSGELRWPEV